MIDRSVYNGCVTVMFALAIATYFTLRKITAPYGRHITSGWGPSLPNRWGWVIMELPAVVVFAFVYFKGAHRLAVVPVSFFCLWQLHYVYRTFIFPWLIRTANKKMPVVIVLLGVAFNTFNAFINAVWISHFGPTALSWMWRVPFIAGVILFIIGFILHVSSDATLIKLRSAGGQEYHIPRGGGYRFVSCPNYLGEIIQWMGWALATFSLAGLAFAVYTVCNLLPRALDHHRWYQKNFADYPRRRMAMIPFLW